MEKIRVGKKFKAFSFFLSASHSHTGCYSLDNERITYCKLNAVCTEDTECGKETAVCVLCHSYLNVCVSEKTEEEK